METAPLLGSWGRLGAEQCDPERSADGVYGQPTSRWVAIDRPEGTVETRRLRHEMRKRTYKIKQGVIFGVKTMKMFHCVF